MADNSETRQKAERTERLQRALRENLRRRKTQARGRARLDSAAAEHVETPQTGESPRGED